MEDEKSLQKLTDFEQKLQRLRSLNKVTYKDISDFNAEELDKLYKYLTEKDWELRGEEKDCFHEKYDDIISVECKNSRWEGNHHQIGYIISCLFREHGRMPFISEVADQSGLSRQTVSKHLKEYNKHPLFRAQIEQFRILSTRLLSEIYGLA